MAEIFLAVQHGAEGFEKHGRPQAHPHAVFGRSAVPQHAARRGSHLDEPPARQHRAGAGPGGRRRAATSWRWSWSTAGTWRRSCSAPTRRRWSCRPRSALYVVVAGLPRAGLRARQEPRRQAAGDRPPRHQPQQRPHQRRGRGEAGRLRHRQGPAQARADRRRRHQGEGGVHVPRAGAGAAWIDRRSDIFSVGSMLYRMLTDKLPFEANNDLESLLRVQKAEFTPPQDAKPAIGAVGGGDHPARDAPRSRRSATRPPTRCWSTSSACCAPSSSRPGRPSSSRGSSSSGGATARRRSARRRATRAASSSDVVGTDLSVGTSFELRDLEQADRTELQRGRTPPPEPARATPIEEGDARRRAAQRAHRGDRRSRRAGAERGARAGSGWASSSTLGAVVGARYLLVWAEHRGVMRRSGIGGSARERPPPPTRRRRAAGRRAPDRRRARRARAAPAPTPPPPSAAQKLAAADADGRGAGAGRPRAGDARRAPGGRRGAARRRKAGSPTASAREEAGRRGDRRGGAAAKAVPNAENAVIGEDEAEAPAPPAGKKPAPLPPKHGAVPGKPSIAEIPRVETAVLHITSAPAGAVVRTKARVLGRTPIALHFKTGNTYEIVFIKSGYEPATRKVAVHSTADRKIAVALKKVAAAQAHLLPPAPMRAAPVTGRAPRRRAWWPSPCSGAPAVGPAPRARAPRTTSTRCAPPRWPRSPRRAPPAARLGGRARGDAAVDRAAGRGRRSAPRLGHQARPRRRVRARHAGDGARPTPTGSPRGTTPTAPPPARWSRPTAPTRTGRCSPTRSTCRAATTRKNDRNALAAHRRAARRLLRSQATTCGACSGSTTARARPTPRPRATSCRSPTCRRSSSRRSAAASSWATTASATTTSCASSPTCAAPTRSIPSASR